MTDLGTNDFPQANSIEQVGSLVEAVDAGYRSDTAIEEKLGLHSQGRQGRYYRHTAELFGLVVTQENDSSLTELGKEFVRLGSANEKRKFLETCFADTALMKRIAPFVESKKPTSAQLRDFVVDLYPGARSTARRRVSSALKYLEGSSLLSVGGGGKLRADSSAGSAFISSRRAARGFTGRNASTIVEPDSTTGGGHTIRVEVDAAKRERANLTHRRLVAAAALTLHRRGRDPQENRLIDLFCDSEPQVLYEMKSVTEGTLAGQVRRAVGQLYEYRFLHKVPEAALCVVTNWQPDDAEQWAIDFLEQDRGIAYAWTNDFNQFLSSQTSAKLLGAAAL